MVPKALRPSGKRRIVRSGRITRPSSSAASASAMTSMHVAIGRSERTCAASMRSMIVGRYQVREQGMWSAAPGGEEETHAALHRAEIASHRFALDLAAPWVALFLRDWASLPHPLPPGGVHV